MAHKTTGSRMRLGEPLASELTALCAALDGNPPEIRIVRDALREFIDKRLKNAEIRLKFEAALKAQRGGAEGDNVVVLPKSR